MIMRDYSVMQGTGLVVLPTEQARYGRLPGENIIRRRRKMMRRGKIMKTKSLHTWWCWWGKCYQPCLPSLASKPALLFSWLLVKGASSSSSWWSSFSNKADHQHNDYDRLTSSPQQHLLTACQAASHASQQPSKLNFISKCLQGVAKTEIRKASSSLRSSSHWTGLFPTLGVSLYRVSSLNFDSRHLNPRNFFLNLSQIY